MTIDNKGMFLSSLMRCAQNITYFTQPVEMSEEKEGVGQKVFPANSWQIFLF